MIGSYYLIATAIGIFFNGIDYTFRFTLTGAGDATASTVLSVIGGVYVGYRLGTVHNSQAYLAGGTLFLIAGVDVVIQYCMY